MKLDQEISLLRTQCAAFEFEAAKWKTQVLCCDTCANPVMMRTGGTGAVGSSNSTAGHAGAFAGSEAEADGGEGHAEDGAGAAEGDD